MGGAPRAPGGLPRGGIHFFAFYVGHKKAHSQVLFCKDVDKVMDTKDYASAGVAEHIQIGVAHAYVFNGFPIRAHARIALFGYHLPDAVGDNALRRLSEQHIAHKFYKLPKASRAEGSQEQGEGAGKRALFIFKTAFFYLRQFFAMQGEQEDHQYVSRQNVHKAVVPIGQIE